MKVLVDSRWAGLTGIGRYYSEIISRVPFGVELEFLNSNFSLSNPLSPWLLKKEIEKIRPDVFWSPGFMPPAFLNKCECSRVVVTVHDLIHLKYYSVLHRLYYEFVLKYFYKSVDYLVTDSLYSMNEIIAWSGIETSKINFFHLGVSDVFSQHGMRYSIGKPYMLYVGNRRRHKNIKRMIEAFSRIKNFYNGVLLLTGPCDEEVLKIADLFGISDRIQFAGIINEVDLPSVYRGADLLFYVSLYEGFGLPPLEAMKCGVATIVSNRSSIPEVVGDAAIIVDPEDVDSIVEGIKSIILNEKLHAEIIDKGLRRVNYFNWSETSNLVWSRILDVKN